jgi:solute:Na+ symporter, SSS family
LFGVEFSTHLVVPASWLATILLSHVLSLVFATRADELSQRWMWKPVVSGETDSLIE